MQGYTKQEFLDLLQNQQIILHTYFENIVPFVSDLEKDIECIELRDFIMKSEVEAIEDMVFKNASDIDLAYKIVSEIGDGSHVLVEPTSRPRFAEFMKPVFTSRSQKQKLREQPAQPKRDLVIQLLPPFDPSVGNTAFAPISSAPFYCVRTFDSKTDAMLYKLESAQ